MITDAIMCVSLLVYIRSYLDGNSKIQFDSDAFANNSNLILMYVSDCNYVCMKLDNFIIVTLLLYAVFEISMVQFFMIYPDFEMLLFKPYDK